MIPKTIWKHFISCIFLSLLTSSLISCCSFNLDFLCLVGVGSGSAFGVGSAAVSGVGLRVGYLSKFFMGNNLLLKLLRTFSLGLNDNPMLFKKDFISSVFVPLIW